MLDRGKVDCTLRVSKTAAGSADQISDEYLDTIINQLTYIHKAIAVHESVKGIDFPAPTLLDVLRSPGVLNRDVVADIDEDLVLSAFRQALNGLIANREGEGTKIADLFAGRIASIRELVKKISEHAASQSEYVQKRLLAKIAKLSVDVDPNRIAQEVALVAQRIDIDEELDRINMHLDQFEERISDSASVGRRLGFLHQELAREANTLASKITVPECLDATIELKVQLDQIREQVLNVE